MRYRRWKTPADYMKEHDLDYLSYVFWSQGDEQWLRVATCRRRTEQRKGKERWIYTYTDIDEHNKPRVFPAWRHWVPAQDVVSLFEAMNQEVE